MPIDPARLNAVGDLILTEPRELRALADPLRLTLFDLVRFHGPVTTTELARLTEQDRASVEGHLRELESVRIVEQAVADSSDVAWATSVKGISFEIPDERNAQQAARELSNIMLAKYAGLPTAWVREEEPLLELEWARAAGLFNARVDLTAEELRGIQVDLERVFEPFTARSSEDVPAGAAAVRILAYFLPEAGRDPPGGATGRPRR
jgi:DNA-binding transcriptional ArsR family regulator